MQGDNEAGCNVPRRWYTSRQTIYFVAEAPMKPSEVPYKKSARGPARAGTVLVVFLLGTGAGAGIYRLIAHSSTAPAVAPVAGKTVPLLTRDERGITVPDGSPLLDKLTVAAVHEKEIKRNLVLPAVVEADPARLVKVLPPLSGRVTQLNVQLGEEIVRGQALAVLDSPDLAAAYADYDRAKVLLMLATKNRDRLRELVKSGGAAIRDQQQAETEYVTAEVENQRAEAKLRQIGVDPDAPSKSRTVTITAPVPGSVIDLAAAPGAIWNDATAALMTVADLSTVWVTANVPEKDTSLVTKGQQVDIAFAAYPGVVFSGEVLFVSNVLDPDTRRTKVRISIPNAAKRFKPAMFANVTFYTPSRMMPVVPTSALVLKDDINQVFVEQAPAEGGTPAVSGTTFKAVPVEVGFEQGDDAVIQRGLEVGDRVVVKGGVLLND
jgi:cobalt-zinc-cadmium efflux system membrane fusion protein